MRESTPTGTGPSLSPGPTPCESSSPRRRSPPPRRACATPTPAWPARPPGRPRAPEVTSGTRTPRAHATATGSRTGPCTSPCPSRRRDTSTAGWRLTAPTSPSRGLTRTSASASLAGALSRGERGTAGAGSCPALPSSRVAQSAARTPALPQSFAIHDTRLSMARACASPTYVWPTLPSERNCAGYPACSSCLALSFR